MVGAQILSGICVLEKGTVSRTKGFENIETDEIARDPKSQRESIDRSNRKNTDLIGKTQTLLQRQEILIKEEDLR